MLYSDACEQIGYLCGGCGPVEIGLVIELFKLLERRAWLLSQAHDNGLSAIVPDGQTRGRSLLWWLEQVVHAITVDLKVL